MRVWSITKKFSYFTINTTLLSFFFKEIVLKNITVKKEMVISPGIKIIDELFFIPATFTPTETLEKQKEDNEEEEVKIKMKITIFSDQFLRPYNPT